jgi:chemotaxis protein methyltransferase CheR
MRAEIIARIKETIRKTTGIIVNEENALELSRVVQNRLQTLGLGEDEYFVRLDADRGEINNLASVFTIQETSFYRFKEHYNWLKLQVLPDLIRKKQLSGGKKILIVSAGCATGEEPYTIGMIIHDLMKDLGEWRVRIVAGDINALALAQAKEGIYTEYKLRNIDQWYVYRYFDRINAKGNPPLFRLKEFIKSMVEFRRLNLGRETFELADLAEVDVVFCENVIIYLSIESIQRLIGNFYSLLAPGGYLFLGPSETLNIVTHQFQLAWWSDSYAYRKPEQPLPAAEAFPLREPVPLSAAAEPDESEGPLPYAEFIYLILQSFEAELYDQAHDLLRKMEKSGTPLNDVFHVIKAEYLFENRQHMFAANECRQALSLNQHSTEAHLLLGAIYLDLGMHDNARYEIKTALYIDPASILGYYYLGLYYDQCGDDTERDYCLAYAKRLLDEQGNLAPSKIFPLYRERRKAIYTAIAGARRRSE